MNEVRINGLTYRQTWRTCNKANCKCKQGSQHGPYWMATDATGRRKYIGKALPEDVTIARDQLRQNAEAIRSTRSDIDRQIEALRAESQALSMLMIGGKPDDKQREIITKHGFESCLIDDAPTVTRTENLVPAEANQDEQEKILVTAGQLIREQEMERC